MGEGYYARSQYHTEGGTPDLPPGQKIMKRKRILYAIVTSALFLTLLAGCTPKEQPAETESPSPTPDTSYVAVPEMDDDLIAKEEEKEITIHYLPQGYAVLESAGQAALFGGCGQDDVAAVSDFLNEQEIQTLTTIVVPNSDESRWSGVEQLRETFGKNLVVVSRAAGDEAYEQFKSGLGSMKMEVGSGSSFNVGTVTFQVLGPVVTEVDDPMAASLVLWGGCGESSFLFADDATEKEINSILAGGVDMKARYIFLNSRGESTIPYAAVQQFSPWELVVADGVAMPDLREQESASMNKLEGKTYSVSAKETVGESDAESNLP